VSCSRTQHNVSWSGLKPGPLNLETIAVPMRPLDRTHRHYFHTISLWIAIADVIWSLCDKDLLYRVLELQKRAARIILYTDRLAPSLTLFNKLGWIPFYEQSKINKCAIFYERINGSLPSYLNNHLVNNNTQHNRSTQYARYNSICPYYKRVTEGGLSFAVSAARLWNNVPQIRLLIY